jgi:hypothetical protein
MKTDVLIDLLARHDVGIAPTRPAPRWLLGVGLGSALALLFVWGVLGWNPQLLHDARSDPRFWLKLFLPLAWGLAGCILSAQAAIPGREVRRVWPAVLLPWLVLGAVAVVVWSNTPAPLQTALIWGSSWKVCSLSIALSAAPVFGASLWVMRGLAPTRLRLAGSLCGLLAGGVGASIYALHCPELAAPFVAIWYALGMLFWVAAGALTGPKLLRW